MNTEEIKNTEDVIDVRGIIARFEYLEGEKEYALENVPESEYGNPDNKGWKEWEESDESTELNLLSSLLEELKGNGGDEDWRGNWYPITLIRDSYFEDYTRELLKDCGFIPKDFPSWIAIDWEETADNCKVDYSTVEFDGVTYWYR